MKRIAVFGGHKNVAGCLKQAKELGYYIITIAAPVSDEIRELSDKCYEISFSEVDKVEQICRHEKIDGITSFTLESALPYVTDVSLKLGLTCNSLECINRIRTKYTQRVAMKNAGIPTPSFVKITAGQSLDDLSLKYPCIVKPVDSGGSQGIHKVSSKSEIGEAVINACSLSRTDGAIIEDYIDGREFSVEYISCRGKHYFCQLTDKITSGEPLFVEIAHHQPANVSDDILQRIKAIVEKALTALKIENSASHTEIKLNSNNELFIIEIGARMGGDKITENLVQLSTGIDFVNESLKLACGEIIEPKARCHKYSGVYHLSALVPQLVRFIDNPSMVQEIVMVNHFKDSLDEVHSNADRSGYIIYQSDKHKVELL